MLLLLLVRQIVECSFDVERRTWLYMRDRPDKLTANHRSVFDKVMTSISDNITVRWQAAAVVQRRAVIGRWQLKPVLGEFERAGGAATVVEQRSHSCSVARTGAFSLVCRSIVHTPTTEAARHALCVLHAKTHLCRS